MIIPTLKTYDNEDSYVEHLTYHLKGFNGSNNNTILSDGHEPDDDLRIYYRSSRQVVDSMKKIIWKDSEKVTYVARSIVLKFNAAGSLYQHQKNIYRLEMHKNGYIRAVKDGKLAYKEKDLEEVLSFFNSFKYILFFANLETSQKNIVNNWYNEINEFYNGAGKEMVSYITYYHIVRYPLYNKLNTSINNIALLYSDHDNENVRRRVQHYLLRNDIEKAKKSFLGNLELDITLVDFILNKPIHKMNLKIFGNVVYKLSLIYSVYECISILSQYSNNTILYKLLKLITDYNIPYNTIKNGDLRALKSILNSINFIQSKLDIQKTKLPIEFTNITDFMNGLIILEVKVKNYSKYIDYKYEEFFKTYKDNPHKYKKYTNNSLTIKPISTIDLMKLGEKELSILSYSGNNSYYIIRNDSIDKNLVLLSLRDNYILNVLELNRDATSLVDIVLFVFIKQWAKLNNIKISTKELSDKPEYCPIKYKSNQKRLELLYQHKLNCFNSQIDDLIKKDISNKYDKDNCSESIWDKL